MKSNIELLNESPEAQSRFAKLLEQHATVIALDAEIVKLSDSLREQLELARMCGVDASNLLAHRRQQKHERLDVFAIAIGKERGKRIGSMAANRAILEAHRFAELQSANNAPFLGEVEPFDDE